MSEKQHPLRIQCKYCVHFKGVALDGNKGVTCSDLGIEGYGIAPRHCYQADPYALMNSEGETLLALGKFFRELSSEELVVLADSIYNMSRLPTHGFKFGQPVYVSLSGQEYLGHFFKAFVVNVTEEHVLIGASINHAKQLTLLRVYPDSIYTGARFRQVRERLLAEGKFLAPQHTCELNQRKLPMAELIRRGLVSEGTASTKDLGYETPTLDTAPPDWISGFSNAELSKLKEVQSVKPVRITPKGGDKRNQHVVNEVQRKTGSMRRQVEADGTVTTVFSSDAKAVEVKPKKKGTSPFGKKSTTLSKK